MPEEINITLPYSFVPRSYQVPIMSALDSGYKRAVQVWHRRSGKEKTDINIIAKKMWERVGAYYYVFPEFSQGRKVLWDGADKEGFRFLDHFPQMILEGPPNNTEMKLRAKNGSLLQIIGSDRYDAVLGTNPIGMVFSEYALQDPACWGYFRPILAENDGWAIFNFTPRGENHAYDLYELAKSDPANWFVDLRTVDDTHAIDLDVLSRERAEIVRLYGNDALYRQEYFCNFSVPISGAYYADQIQQAYAAGHVGNVPHESSLSVDTWWDLGINDRMSIWFTQSVGQELRAIDYMEGSGKGLDHYIREIKSKPYVYGKHTAPHDIEVRELSSGKSRRETARNLGIDFEIAPNIPIMDGIDASRSLFGKTWFDREKCREGLNALKNYRKQYDEKRKTYSNTPLHDWSSNGADAFRYLAVSLDFKHRSMPAKRPDAYERDRLSRRNENLMGVFG